MWPRSPSLESYSDLCGQSLSTPNRNPTLPRRLDVVTSYRTTALMTVEGPRKGEPSTKTVRYGLRTQPATSVRGSSRRIMSMRFRPANISVINRRASSQAVIGPAVQNQLKAHQQDHDPATPPVEAIPEPERCSPSRVRCAAPNCGAPLTAVRRSGQVTFATSGSGGIMIPGSDKTKEQNLGPP